MASTHDQHPSYENGQDIRDRSFEFACRATAFCEELYAAGGVGRLMVFQILKCTTSVAAMLEEARAAESTPDFVSKCCIGLKECRESHVRLRICVARRVGPHDQAAALVQEANELVAIITTIVRNKKRNAAKKPRGKSRFHDFQIRDSKFQIPNS
jgi:four helix bundle protein